MTSLSIAEMANYESGLSTLGKICVVVGAGVGIFNIGVALEWWNPVGWVCGVATVIGWGCDIYSANEILNDIQGRE